MLDILGITMKNDNCYRIAVKSTDTMNKAWLEVLNKDNETPITFEQAIKESCYLSNNDGYLVMEIEVNLNCNIYQPMYYFDDYENIDVEISEGERKQCIDFIETWHDKLPDNDELSLGDADWLSKIPDDIPWKKNLI